MQNDYSTTPSVDVKRLYGYNDVMKVLLNLVYDNNSSNKPEKNNKIRAQKKKEMIDSNISLMAPCPAKDSDIQASQSITKIASSYYKSNLFTLTPITNNNSNNNSNMSTFNLLNRVVSSNPKPINSRNIDEFQHH